MSYVFWYAAKRIVQKDMFGKDKSTFDLLEGHVERTSTGLLCGSDKQAIRAAVPGCDTQVTRKVWSEARRNCQTCLDKWNAAPGSDGDRLRKWAENSAPGGADEPSN